jgi:hypothetical protein
MSFSPRLLSARTLPLVSLALALSLLPACNKSTVVDGGPPGLVVNVTHDTTVPAGTLVIFAACSPCQNTIEFLMDGVNKGALRCGQQHTFPISPGHHEIAFQPSWGAGAVLQVPETSGVYVIVSCST